MEYKMVELHIAKFTNGVTYNSLKTTKSLIVILYFISICLLITTENVPFLVALSIISAAEWVYFSDILKKRKLTVYKTICVSFLFVLYLVITLTVWLYCIQIIFHSFDPFFFFALLIVELLCVIAGFFYTRRCVKNGMIGKMQAPAFSSVVVSLGVLGYFGVRCVISQFPVLFQHVILTLGFSFGIFMLMFVLGMVHVAILYYMKKYNIRNHRYKGDGSSH